MIRELTIKNYRGFKDFKIDSFDRVNLIAGANNVGKTSLLEAIYLNLVPTMSDWPTPIKFLRGFEILDNRVRTEDMWGWVFYKKDFENEVEVTVIDDAKKIRSLKIRFHPIPREFHFRVQTMDGAEAMAFFVSSSGGFNRPEAIPLPQFNGKPVSVGVVIGNKNRSIEEDAKLFSKIDDSGRKEELIKPLKFLDNRVRDLAVSVASGLPMINCDIGIGQRIPLTQMGEGMVHFFSVISEIVYSAGGVVLIDDVENGLHHSVMVDVWKAIAEAAEKSNTQIFATTHSFECIRAAHQAFSERDVYDLRLHRLERVNDEIKAVTYNQNTLETSLEMNWEVR